MNDTQSIDLECNECDNPINGKWRMSPGWQSPKLVIEPCGVCLKKAEAEGRDAILQVIKEKDIPGLMHELGKGATS